MQRSVRVSTILLLCLCAAWGAPLEARKAARELFEDHKAGATGLGKKLQGFFGYMPAVASTPYLSLAAISGIALFAETEYARTSTNPWVRQMCDAAPVQTARKYTSRTLFGVLALLALMSFVGSSGKLRATVGKLLGMAEGTVAGVAYVALAIGSFAAPALIAEPPQVVLMGFDIPKAVGLGLALAVGLGLLLVVRFAFDVLIWLSPFPLVDFLFEVVKNVVSLGLLALYFLSPAVAAGLAAVLVLIALVLYGWSIRILELAFGRVLQSVLTRFFPSLRSGLVDEDIVTRLELGSPRIATPATALALGGVPKRRSGALVQTEAGLFFVPRTYLRKARWLPLGQGPQKPVLSRGLFWLELQTVAPGGQVQRIALSRTLQPDAERLRALLGAEDGGFLGGARLLQKLAERIGGGPSLQPAAR